MMLALVAMLSCYIPAARATQTDTLIGLRTEEVHARLRAHARTRFLHVANGRNDIQLMKKTGFL